MYYSPPSGCPDSLLFAQSAAAHCCRNTLSNTKALFELQTHSGKKKGSIHRFFDCLFFVIVILPYKTLKLLLCFLQAAGCKHGSCEGHVKNKSASTHQRSTDAFRAPCCYAVSPLPSHRQPPQRLERSQDSPPRPASPDINLCP